MVISHFISFFSGSLFRCWVLTKKFAWETQITSKYIIGMRLSRNVFNICKFYCCELGLIKLLWIFSYIHVFWVWRSKRKFSYDNAEIWDLNQILPLYNPFFRYIHRDALYMLNSIFLIIWWWIRMWMKIFLKGLHHH